MSAEEIVIHADEYGYAVLPDGTELPVGIGHSVTLVPRPTGPQTDAGKRLLDYILSGFEGSDDPVALVVAVERAAEAWGKFRGIEMARAASKDHEP